MSQAQAEQVTRHLSQMMCEDRDKLADLYVTKEFLKRVSSEPAGREGALHVVAGRVSPELAWSAAGRRSPWLPSPPRRSLCCNKRPASPGSERRS